MTFSSKEMDLMIGTLINNRPEDVRQMLMDSGVSVPADVSKKQLTIAFLKAVQDSASFRQYVADYLTGLVQHESVGSYGFVNNTPARFNVDGEGNASGAMSGDALNNLFNVGLTGLSGWLTEKTQKAGQERALTAKQLELQKAALELETAKLNAGAGKAGVGVGGVLLILLLLAGVGTGIYFIARKKG